MKDINNKFADLFCGAGGLSIGLRNAGLIPSVAVDIWDLAERHYLKWFPEASFFRIDISDDKERMRLASHLKDQRIFVLAGGPPCQGFSTLGKRKAEDKRNMLVDAYLDVIEQVSPPVLIIENVTGLKSMTHDNGLKYPEHILNSLRNFSPGYEAASVLLNGIDFGLAQARKRVFFVAIRKDFFKSLDLESSFGEVFNQCVESCKRDERRILKDVIYDLPMIESGEGEDVIIEDDRIIYNHKAFEHSRDLLRKLKFVKYGGGLQDIPRRHLSNHLRKMVDGEYGSGGFIKNLYGRLVWEKPTGTVVAGIRKVTCGRFVHPESNRFLTVRECARLQGFPENYKFEGSVTEQYTLVGNAVPPVFGEVLGKAITDVLYAKNGALRLCL